MIHKIYQLFISFATFLFSRRSQQTMQVYLEAGIADKKKKEYAKALRKLQVILRLAEDGEVKLKAHNEIGHIYLERGELEKAKNVYESIVAKGNDNEQTHFGLGMIFKQQNSLEEALRAFSRSLELNTGNKEIETKARIEIAGIHLRQQRYDTAQQEYESIICAGYIDADVCLELGVLYAKKKRHGEALQKFKDALNAGNTDRGKEGRIRYALGDVYECQRQFELSEKEYIKAIELGYDNDAIHIKLGTVYIALEKYDLAERELNRALEMNRSPEAFLALTGLFKKRKKLELCLQTGMQYLESESAIEYAYNMRLKARIEAAGTARPANIKMRFKIIRTNTFYGPTKKEELQYSFLLPLGMGKIVSYLRSQGIAIDQDDLYIRINHANAFGDNKDKIDMNVFFDEKRIVAYCDGNDDDEIESLLAKIEAKTQIAGYDVILLSLYDGYEQRLEFVLALLRYIKKKYNPIIIVGGYNTLLNSLIKNRIRDIDYVVIGKGERLLFKVLTALQCGTDLRSIPEVMVKEQNNIIEDCNQNITMIAPDYDGLPLELYKYRGAITEEDDCLDTRKIIGEFNHCNIMVTPFDFMEGCFYECIFCCNSTSPGVFSFSHKKVVEYLGEMKRKYGIRCYFFLVCEVNASRAYIHNFCDAIIAAGLDILWVTCARADNLDRDTLFKMRRAGCIRVIYGAESMSPRMLQYLDKRINVQRLEQIIQWTDEAGIWCGLEIICGLPHETKEDLDIIVRFIKKNRKYINKVYYNVFNLIGVSKMYAYPEKYAIKNIFEITRPFARIFDVRYGFDEVGGLSWDSKMKQMTEAYQYLLRETGEEHYNLLTNETEHLLFYLYSTYGDKKVVADMFEKVRKNLAMKRGGTGPNTVKI